MGEGGWGQRGVDGGLTGRGMGVVTFYARSEAKLALVRSRAFLPALCLH